MKKAERKFLESDPKMKLLVLRHKEPRLGGEDPYYATLTAVAGQQLSGVAAKTIWTRVMESVGAEPLKLRRCRISTLRKAGLSQAKANTVKLVARAKLDGLYDDLESKTDEEVVESLTSIKGVGPWTAQMVMMFAMGRKDIWPVGDGGVQRTAADLYGAKKPAQLEALGDRFKPVRSLAACYLWRHLDA
jgi:DNA-3-methyladenine glycosylase II